MANLDAMPTVEAHPLDGYGGYGYAFSLNGRPLAFQKALALMQTDASFQALLTDCFCRAPYNAFRWETPSLSNRTKRQQFRFVLLDSPNLCVAPDRLTFSRHFEQATSKVIATFENLGADATLIAPAPLGQQDNYAHLGAFFRNAPQNQIKALWQSIGATTLSRIESRPLWLNTAGDGVAWLHVRLDTRPKYYRYRPYAMGS